mmetsp:Transcript_55507/g.130998  ORF Transcript_55507/g.130998 Transcript_55507/m.130998 type:complete len:213 (-) Transcript_55507:111-749(-)
MQSQQVPVSSSPPSLRLSWTLPSKGDAESPVRSRWPSFHAVSLAKESGLRSERSCAMGSARASSRTSTHSRDPASTARCRGVVSQTVGRTASMSSFRAARRAVALPLIAALCDGRNSWQRTVDPRARTVPRSGLTSGKVSRDWCSEVRPLSAHSSAHSPSSSGAFTFAPPESSASTALSAPSPPAKCKGVKSTLGSVHGQPATRSARSVSIF